MGALLRREGVYSSLLTNWRRQREQGALQDLRARRRGPKPRSIDPRVTQLEAENRRLHRKLQRAETIHHAPKKSCRDPGDPPEAPRQRRDRLMIAIEAVTAKGETSALCQSVGLARASLYRRRHPARPAGTVPARRPSSRAPWSRPNVKPSSTCCTASGSLTSLRPKCMRRCWRNSGTSARCTMYRVLAEAHEVRERRAQAQHPSYAKPELVATAPNQVWSWDITKLKGPVPYLYYALYVILDLFSRYVVGWMVAVNESAHLPERLIEQTCAKQGIQPQQHHDSRRPRRAHAQQARRAVVLRPRHRGEPLTAAREQ